MIALVIWARLPLALYKALQGHRAHRVPPGRKEIPALKALRVRKALKGFRVRKVHRVQQALKVQFYPTMVLVDRDGRILHLEQGATDATLGRTDRSIASVLRDPDDRRSE